KRIAGQCSPPFQALLRQGWTVGRGAPTRALSKAECPPEKEIRSGAQETQVERCHRMSLTQRLEQDMKAAMKNKDKAKLGVIRMLRSAIKNMEIERGRPLEEDEVLDVLARELKQRKESLQEFEKAGRSELAEKVKAEIAVVETYLPAPLSREELRELARQVIDEVGASTPADMGKVMKEIVPRVKGRADGKEVNRIVR